jgi:hypothetical protein
MSSKYLCDINFVLKSYWNTHKTPTKDALNVWLDVSRTTPIVGVNKALLDAFLPSWSSCLQQRGNGSRKFPQQNGTEWNGTGRLIIRLFLIRDRQITISGCGRVSLRASPVILFIETFVSTIFYFSEATKSWSQFLYIILCRTKPSQYSFNIIL